MNTPETFTRIYDHPKTQAVREAGKPIAFFLFPETFENPLPNQRWFPYMAMLFRIWMYGLVLHHLEELKTLAELIPFVK